MLEAVREMKPVELNESDVITLADASRISGRRIPVISAMLDRGSLPWYEYAPTFPGKSGQRLTSRRAVLDMAAKKKTGMASQARKRK